MLSLLPGLHVCVYVCVCFLLAFNRTVEEGINCFLKDLMNGFSCCNVHRTFVMIVGVLLLILEFKKSFAHFIISF